jgi:hypothetical protein
MLSDLFESIAAKDFADFGTGENSPLPNRDLDLGDENLVVHPPLDFFFGCFLEE